MATMGWSSVISLIAIAVGLASLIFCLVRIFYSTDSRITVVRNIATPGDIVQHFSSEAGSRVIRNVIRNNASDIRRVLEGNDTAPEESEWINHYTSRSGSRIKDRRYNTRTGEVEILYPPPVPSLPETRLLRE